jgi:ribonucleoside-diphosphate reductase alpha chain
MSALLSENALIVAKKRYLQPDETPEDMFRRVAKCLAKVEEKYGKTQEEINKYEEEFYSILSTLKYLPGGRTLANAGTRHRLVNNCIVLPIEDSMEGIFETLKQSALLQQAGSGLGYSFSSLRYAGCPTKTSGGHASGPVSFLKVYNEAFSQIKGRNRNGANMAIVRIDHPDILEFISCKTVEGKIKCFNISVGITDKFMEAVINNSSEPWMCNWKGEEMLPREVIRDKDGAYKEAHSVTLTASELFRKICKLAHSNGEPGIFMEDEVNKYNPVPGLGRIEACNPCAELGMHSYDVCNLGSINLVNFAKEPTDEQWRVPRVETSEPWNKDVKWKELEQTIRLAVRMQDNVIDICDQPVEKVNNMARANRRIGLGIMGYAWMLQKLRIPYDSETGQDVARQIMKYITEISMNESAKLAREKGCFPNISLSIYADQDMRNCAITTIPPTGTIAMLADTSSGCEPDYSLGYVKHCLGKEVLKYVNRILLVALKANGITDESIVDRIILNGSLKNMSEIPEHLRRIFVTSMDISPEAHVKVQAAFQEHVHTSISKTINLPNKATVKDVEDAIKLGYRLKIKGMTLYRDQSRMEQVLNLNTSVQKEDSCPDCSSRLVKSDGCNKCSNISCGYARCG